MAWFLEFLLLALYDHGSNLDEGDKKDFLFAALYLHYDLFHLQYATM
jgi:hypothetical protein